MGFKLFQDMKFAVVKLEVEVSRAADAMLIVAPAAGMTHSRSDF